MKGFLSLSAIYEEQLHPEGQQMLPRKKLSARANFSFLGHTAVCIGWTSNDKAESLINVSNHNLHLTLSIILGFCPKKTKRPKKEICQQWLIIHRPIKVLGLLTLVVPFALLLMLLMLVLLLLLLLLLVVVLLFVLVLLITNMFLLLLLFVLLLMLVLLLLLLLLMLLLLLLATKKSRACDRFQLQILSNVLSARLIEDVSLFFNPEPVQDVQDFELEKKLKMSDQVLVFN